MEELLKQLAEWMNSEEDEHLEFKEAKTQFDFEKLVRYCVALANEGGGRFILGVTDQIPRQVVSTQAYQNLEKTKTGLMERLRLRIEADEIKHPRGAGPGLSYPLKASWLLQQPGG